MRKIEETKLVNGTKFSKAYEEVSVKDTSSKAKLRKDIQDIRGDLYDIVADSLKWNSILTTVVSRIWDSMDTTQKEGVQDHLLIDTFVNKFKSTQTRMDKQLATDGIGTIDKILDREKNVGALFT